jgi:hypothetical protein
MIEITLSLVQFDKEIADHPCTEVFDTVYDLLTELGYNIKFNVIKDVKLKEIVEV